MQKTVHGHPYEPYEDEIDLRQLFSVLWASKILLVIVTLVFTSTSVIYALVIPNQYKATALLVPTQQNSSRISSALNQFGGLASLAGINIGGNQNGDTKIAFEVIQSRSFIEQFIKQSGIMIEVMAAKGWNYDNKRLVLDKDIYDPQSRQWMRSPPLEERRLPVYGRPIRYSQKYCRSRRIKKQG
jgi:uncharacterized protein involved in exopolysaccharide biosynthesis